MYLYSIDEVESVMAGGQWPPAEDRNPKLFRKWATLSTDCRSMVPVDIPVVSV